MEILYGDVLGHIALTQQEADVISSAQRDPFVQDGESYSIFDFLEDECPDAHMIDFDERMRAVRFEVLHFDHEYSVRHLKTAIGHVLDGTWKKRFEENYFV